MPMVLHHIDSTDVSIHQLGHILEKYMSVIITRYVHRFGYSSGKGARAVVHRARCVQFASFRKQSCSLSAEHWSTCTWFITFSFQLYAWSIFSDGSCADWGRQIEFSLLRTLILSFYMQYTYYHLIQSILTYSIYKYPSHRATTFESCVTLNGKEQ